MKTEFTDTEKYEVYSQAIIEDMMERYNLTYKSAKKILAEDNFENDFMRQPKNYDFMEPSKMSRLIFRRVADKRRKERFERFKKRQKEEPVKKVPPLNPNPDRKDTTVNMDNLSTRLKANRDQAIRRARD